MAFLNVFRTTLAYFLLLTSVSASCVSPKVRKEWRSLDSAERAAWIDGIKCIANLPHDPKLTVTVDPAISLIPPIAPNSSYYDDFSYAHMDLNVLIHGTGFFLPWHRIYVQTMEDRMKEKCGYKGVHPYWDWTKDAADFYHATIFSDDPKDGLGGWGDPENDFQISTGSFKDIQVAYPVPHHIRRNYTLQPFLGAAGPPPSGLSVDFMANTTFTKENVDYTINSFTGDFNSFQPYLSGLNGPHSGPHSIVGADLFGACPFGLAPPNCYPGPKWAPNDPLFFLHHATVDKIWYEWQNRDPSNKNAFSGGSVNSFTDPTAPPNGAPPLLSLDSVIPSDGLWENLTVRDVMDTTGEKLCYIYA